MTTTSFTSSLADRFEIGSTVSNFGFTAWVIDYHPIVPMLVLQDYTGVKWLADPDKCVKVIGRPYAHQAA